MEYSYDISPYARSMESSIYNIDSSTATAIGAALGAFAGLVLIVSIVVCILQIVAMWKLFSKAGQKGWKSIIPIYNLVILYKICGITPWLILAYLALIIPFVGWIVAFVLLIYQSNKLAKSFGKDIGYTIGLVIPATSTIFYLILGLGNSTYVGPGGIPEVVNKPTDDVNSAE